MYFDLQQAGGLFQKQSFGQTDQLFHCCTISSFFSATSKIRGKGNKSSNVRINAQGNLLVLSRH
jgi:hypothetical protein